MWSKLTILFLLCASSVSAQVVNPTTGSGSGVGAGASPVMGTYFGPNCPVANTGQCVFTTADVQQTNQCGWTNTTGVITCTGSPFVAGDVGKSVIGNSTCGADITSAQAAGGIAPNAAMPTIITFNNANSVTISATPVNAQSIAAGPPAGGCFVWGHIDDANAVLLDTQLAASLVCPKVFLAAANYLFTKPPAFMFTQYQGCINIGPLVGSATSTNLGSTALGAGYEIEGRGTGPTGIYLATNFPNGDVCHHSPGSAVTGNFTNGGGCFSVPMMGKWSDFRIDGAGQHFATGMTSKTLIVSSTGTIQNFTCINYGDYQSSTFGHEIAFLTQLYQYNNSGCGATGMVIDANTSGVLGYRVTIESASQSALVILGSSAGLGYSMLCEGCVFAGADSQLGGPFPIIQNRGGTLRLIGARIGLCNGNQTGLCPNIAGVITYSSNTTTGGVFYADNTTFETASGSGANTDGGVLCSVVCTNYFSQSALSSQSGSFDIQDVAGSKEYDLGGNAATPRMSISGNVFGSNSVTGTVLAAANLTPTTNFGTGCATAGQCMSAVSGSSGRSQFTVTYGTGPASPQTLTVTFPTTFWVAPFCTLTDVGGTNAFPTSITTTSTSTTTAIFSIVNTPVAGNTDIFQLSCGAS